MNFEIAPKMIARLLYSLRIIFLPERYNNKIFCIGFNKTGTTSCGRALQILGYRHSSFNKKLKNYYKNNEIVKILKYTSKFDSFDDVPWSHEDMIPLLDRVFPRSKFVYLTRNEDTWKKSIINWTLKMTGNHPNIEDKLQKYRKHREFILNYFKNKPGDQFLILDVSEINAFQKLAEFLGKKTDRKSFPHLNKTSEINGFKSGK